jgi:hypothetical protein
MLVLDEPPVVLYSVTITWGRNDVVGIATHLRPDVTVSELR